MAVHIIPTPPVGVYRWLLRREFEGRFYRMLYRWNVRGGVWFVDWADDTNLAQVRNVRMSLGKDKLQAFHHLTVPPGTLDVIDSTASSTEPTLSSFGDTVQVRYTDFVDESVVPVAPAVVPT